MLGLVLQAEPKTVADITVLFTILSGLFSGVSIIVLVAGAWKLASLLAKIELKLEFLSDIPGRVREIESSIATLKSDVNSLWSAHRDKPHSSGEK